MADLNETMLEKASAWLDGELDDAEAAEVVAWLEAHPEAGEQIAAMRGAGALLRTEAETWDRELDFDGFYDGVAARLESRPARAPRGQSLWDRFVAFFGGHSLAASAATILVVVGAGYAYWVGGTPHVPKGTPPVPALELSGGGAEIEDLEFETAGAVVYKTSADVTVVWISDE